MGLHFADRHFTDRDYLRFAERLEDNLAGLRECLARPSFGLGEPSLGAELELHLVTENGKPALVNRNVLGEAMDKRFTMELNRFNIEFNATPVPFARGAFASLEEEVSNALIALDAAAQASQAQAVPIGILPTLELRDLHSSVLSDAPRYHILSRVLRKNRDNAPFRICINGRDPLDIEAQDVTLEGANASWQLHLKVEPKQFVATYNAAQIATAPVLAACGNSPFFLGHRLWQESRIALFKHAVDDRAEQTQYGWPPPRVCFGHGWVRKSAYELFAEAVALYPPLLPILSGNSAREELARNQTPRLLELRMHLGTIWRWNRPVYGPEEGGHIRIELRALPSGPSVTDMVANSAFLIGLTLGLRQRVESLLTQLPFAAAHSNFYRSAQYGLGATLLWPCEDAPSPRPIAARALVHKLLPTALAGLTEAGVDSIQAQRLLGVIEQRTHVGQTGSKWQLDAYNALVSKMSRQEAFQTIVTKYREHCRTNQPVHEWSPLCCP